MSFHGFLFFLRWKRKYCLRFFFAVLFGAMLGIAFVSLLLQTSSLCSSLRSFSASLESNPVRRLLFLVLEPVILYLFAGCEAAYGVCLCFALRGFFSAISFTALFSFGAVDPWLIIACGLRLFLTLPLFFCTADYLLQSGEERTPRQCRVLLLLNLFILGIVFLMFTFLC